MCTTGKLGLAPVNDENGGSIIDPPFVVRSVDLQYLHHGMISYSHTSPPLTSAPFSCVAVPGCAISTS